MPVSPSAVAPTAPPVAQLPRWEPIPPPPPTIPERTIDAPHAPSWNVPRGHPADKPVVPDHLDAAKPARLPEGREFERWPAAAAPEGPPALERLPAEPGRAAHGKPGGFDAGVARLPSLDHGREFMPAGRHETQGQFVTRSLTDFFSGNALGVGDQANGQNNLVQAMQQMTEMLRKVSEQLEKMAPNTADPGLQPGGGFVPSLGSGKNNPAPTVAQPPDANRAGEQVNRSTMEAALQRHLMAALRR